MKNVKLFVGALIFIIVGSCTQEPLNEQVIEEYFSESFANLDISTLQSLETPYESIFNPSITNGRTNGEFADIAEIAAKLDEIFPDADVLEIESETERGLDVWEIKIVMPGGGILKIVIVKELGEIIKMKGKTGPYDYEIEPGGSFITFSAAKQIALDEVGGELIKWNLGLEEDDRWEYEFHIVTDTERFEVEIDAFTGDILSIKKKKEDDDKDNDGDEEGDDEGEDEEVNNEAPAEVIDFVLALFPGEIKHSERIEEHDFFIAWKLYIVNEAGSAVKFLVTEDPIELIKMEGEKGPFNYNIEPGGEILSLNEVKDIIFSEFDGEIVEWELKSKSTDEGHMWIYEFKVQGETVKYKIMLNAVSGEILSVKEKNEDEDEDSDVEDEEDHAQAPSEVTEFVLALFPGEIKHSQKREDHNLVFWELYVVNDAGSTVKFLVIEDPLELFEMEGEIGPFDYNIEPGGDIISFDAAKDIVFSEAEGMIKEWELKNKSTDEGHMWIYEFKVRDENVKYEIVLNAVTGEIIEFNVHD